MKLSTLFLMLVVSTAGAPRLYAQDDTLVDPYTHLRDSLHTGMPWKTGEVTLNGDIAKIQVPAGWRYLPSEASEWVLTDLWGNPPSASLGMLFPENTTPIDTNLWAFNITYDEIGYVKDDDADKFNYDDILKQSQEEAAAANTERVKEGYETMEVVAWASRPFYDKEKKALHWAKELKFGDAEDHTLNYDVRLLGRKGVLSMNAIGDMAHLDQVKQSVPAIIGSTNFNQGHRYADFDVNVDEVAAWSIGGLVAGKVLAKAGFFALILKFLKPILLVLAASGAAIWRWISGRKKEEEEMETAVADAPPPSDAA